MRAGRWFASLSPISNPRDTTNWGYRRCDAPYAVVSICARKPGAPWTPHPFTSYYNEYPMTCATDGRFTAIVLAGDRTDADPVARAAGTPCKALAPVAGRPMVLRVLDALTQSQAVGRIVLCGPAETIVQRTEALQQRLADGRTRWMPPRATPSTSALAALGTVLPEDPVLLTTADHALLRPEMIDQFCRESVSAGCDVTAALADYDRVMERFPGMRRTRTRFQDGPVCGCNLFAFLTPAGRQAADFWRQVEHERKHPVRMINRLGWSTVVCYLLGRLRLADALGRISDRMGMRVGSVLLPFPEAAVDVDTPDDWRFADAIAAGRAGHGGGR